MIIFEWVAWYDFFSINFNWIFGIIVGVILFLFWKTEKSSYSKDNWQTIGKGWRLEGREFDYDEIHRIGMNFFDKI